MIHLLWETTASPAGDAVSPEGDLLASPNFGICDTTHINYPKIKLDKKSIHWLSQVITTENDNDFIDLTRQKNRKNCFSRKIETTNYQNVN
jgi:hypothetical protein